MSQLNDSQQIFGSHFKMNKLFCKNFKKLFLVGKLPKKLFVTFKAIHEFQILSGLMTKVEKKILGDIYYLASMLLFLHSNFS